MLASREAPLYVPYVAERPRSTEKQESNDQDWALHTDEQYEAGKEELITRLTRYYDSQSKNSNAAVSPTRGNIATESEWSDDDNDDVVLIVSASVKKATAELEKYQQWNKSRFLPEMKKVKCLGAFDDDGHRQREPILHLGPVTKKNLDLPSGHNHAEYINVLKFDQFT